MIKQLNKGVVVYCSKCGKEIDENSKFCSGCGREVGRADHSTLDTPQIAEDSLSEDQARVVNSASWGATLGIFYAIGMQSWTWLIIILAVSFLSPFALGIPSIIVAIFFIVKGGLISKTCT